MYEFQFRVTLCSRQYDENEQELITVHGTRTYIGTEDDAIERAQRTRTSATEALIERIATSDGVQFRAHEIRSFTIGLTES